ncbi:unnamed protein product [Ambrosiozyma monospora]|uniref:Unnamed protein product n=1 Tax=Ambrosiozyma monospora TaxID=43982 RepID=A0A9W6YZ87_AMBMO|nr:unnamed protein product [Ambrosiozyma monospora]
MGLVRELILNKFRNANDKEMIIIIDCAYQFGNKELPNSFMFSIYKELWLQNGVSVTEAFFKRILVFRDFNSLKDVNNLLEHLLERIPKNFREYQLGTVVVSNTSIFYWSLRNDGDNETLNKFYKNCQLVSQKFHCPIISCQHTLN